jgi:hypothetical protein
VYDVKSVLDTLYDPWLDWPPVAEYAKRREAGAAAPSTGLELGNAKL